MNDRRISPRGLATNLGAWRSGAAGPAFRKLAAALRLLILDGRLPLQSRLPGERELARILDVSRTTISAAFAELRADGYLSSRHGSGSVAVLPSPAAGQPGRRAATDRPDILDFLVAALPAGPEIHHAYRVALDALPAHLPGIGYDRLGVDELREVVARRYSARGVPTSIDEVMIVNGALAGFALCLRLLVAPGDRVAIDVPTYPAAIAAIRASGCRPVGVPLTEEGWDEDGLAAAFGQTTPRLAYLVVDHHNPTGRVMSAETRARVAAITARHRTTLVIDETMVDLWYEAPPPPPFAAYDPSSITLGSAGKSFWGGMRVGWIRAPAATIAALALTRESFDLGSPVLEQLAAAHLLADPDPILAERRTLLRMRRDYLIGSGSARFPDWRFPTPIGGLSCWVELPQAASTALAGAAEVGGVRIAPGTRFGTDGALDRFVRLPFATEPETIDAMFDRLQPVWHRIGIHGVDVARAGIGG